jgi:hypothetical protein
VDDVYEHLHPRVAVLTIEVPGMSARIAVLTIEMPGTPVRIAAAAVSKHVAQAPAQ